MGEQFFGQLSDIRKIAPLRLEEILQEPYISQKDGKLIFTYWVNMEPWEDKPLLVDNNGQFWIGKKSNGYNFVLEEYGRNISEFLGCPSPEVEYYDSNGSSQVLSKFVHHSRDPTLEELETRGQITLAPRLLAAYSGKITDGAERLFGRLDCDINRGNFLIGSNDTFYQIDFSRPVERLFTLSDIKGRLNVFGLTTDPENEIVRRQIIQIRQYDFNELYRQFTPKAHQLLPRETERYLPMFLWNFSNIYRLLSSLHMSNESRIRIIFHNDTAP